MTCHDARAMFSDLAEQALAAAERATCEAHLAGCADCRREWEAFQRMLALLHDMPRLHAPAGFADRVLGAVQPPWHQRLRRRRFVPLPVKLPLEAAALVLVAVGAVWLVQRTPEVQQATPTLDQHAPETGQAERFAFSQEEKTSPPLPETTRKPAAERRVPAAAREETPALTPEPRTDAPLPAAPERKMTDRQVEAPRAAAAPEARRNVTGTLARVASPPVVSGRLVVQDRGAAEQALRELATRVGATEVSRRPAGEATVLELDVPGPAFKTFARSLDDLGQWSPDRDPAELSSPIRVVVRITR
jgi:hypothetical protein